jgi:single-strand DNA-binding protein
MNSINLTGNICNDLELKSTQSGKSVITVNLAVKRPFTKDTTDFIPLVVWEKNAEYLSRYGKKGSRVAVSGKLTTRKYQDKDGKNRTAFEVVCDNVELMDSKSEADSAPTFNPPKEPNYEEVDPDGDLPF